MNFWHEYPYTDFHELNLSWILKKMKQIDARMTDFEAVNKFNFFGDWNITKSYPIWSIVTGEDDNGYLAIQNVPAGITLDNEDYWIKVANYSALYADVQRRIIAIEDDNKSIHEDLTTAEGDISDLQSDVLDLENAVDELQREDRNVLCIGDSYQEGYNPEGNTLSFINMLKSKYESVTGSTLTLYNYHKGGTGFLNANDNITFHTLLENAGANIADRSSITDIIVTGGYNDSGYSDTDLKSSIQTFINRAKSLFPKSKIWIAPAGYCLNNSVRDRIENNVIPAYCAASNYGAFIMSTTLRLYHLYTLLNTTDFVHPTQTGQDILGELMAYELMGKPLIKNATNCGDLLGVTLTLNNAAWSINASNFSEWRLGDDIMFWSNMSDITVVDSKLRINPSGGDNPALGQFSTVLLGGQIHANEYFYTAPAIFKTTNNKYAVGVLKFYLEQSGTLKTWLKFHAYVINTTNDNYLTDIIEVYGFNLTNIKLPQNLF